MTYRHPCSVARLDPSSLSCDADSALAATYLDPMERMRLLSFRHGPSRRNFLFGRVLAKGLVGRQVGCAPGDVRIECNTKGKPLVAAPTSARALAVSISHTEGLVAVAVGGASRLGIDVEKIDRPSQHLPFSDRILAGHELRDVLAHSPAERVGRFLQYWTLKEAWAKSVGVGLGVRLCEIVFDLSSPTAAAAALSPSRVSEHWHATLVCIGVTHLLAVCACADDATPIEWLVWDSQAGDPLREAPQLQQQALPAALRAVPPLD